VQAAQRRGSPSVPTAKEQHQRTFVRLTAVFDRSQVDELPPPAEPAPLESPAAAEIDGDELAPWLESLTALAAEIGSTVAFESIASGADGYYRPSTKRSLSIAGHDARPLDRSRPARGTRTRELDA
jgi:hypothetical protein